MARNEKTSATVDSILKLLVIGSSLSAALLAPNILQALDKPVGSFLKNMDRRARQREINRILYYMKQQRLISAVQDYEHGITITDKGRRRLKEVDLDRIRIQRPKQWDKKWRLVFFDIPEKHKTGRDALVRKLKELGFYQLQRSVLVFPHPCREAIAAVTGIYGINKYVSYIETGHIDQQNLLKRKFRMFQYR